MSINGGESRKNSEDSVAMNGGYMVVGVPVRGTLPMPPQPGAITATSAAHVTASAAMQHCNNHHCIETPLIMLKPE